MSASAEPVSTAVRELIRERIQALEQLEILLLLQNEPGRTWSREELATRLGVELMLIEAALAHLRHHRLIDEDPSGRYRYAPPSTQVHELVAALAESYTRARVEVLALISSDAVHRVRHRARQLMRRLSDKPQRR